MAAFVQGFQRINVFVVSMPADLKGGRVLRENQKRELHSCSLLFFESDWVCLTLNTCRHSACGTAGCWQIKFALRNYRGKFITYVSRVRITLCFVFYENPGGAYYAYPRQNVGFWVYPNRPPPLEPPFPPSSIRYLNGGGEGNPKCSRRITLCL